MRGITGAVQPGDLTGSPIGVVFHVQQPYFSLVRLVLSVYLKLLLCAFPLIKTIKSSGSMVCDLGKTDHVHSVFEYKQPMV